MIARSICAGARSKRVLAGTLCAMWLAAVSGACGDGADAPGPGDHGDAGHSLSRTGKLHVRVLDPVSGEPIACKLLINGSDPKDTPSWGSVDMVGDWVGPQTLESSNQIYGDPCDAVLELTGIDFDITASQGIEREIVTQHVHVTPNHTTSLTLMLPRALDTTGYASCDFHVHSAPSFDSAVPLDQRLIGARGEGMDAIAPTDHDSVGDWQAELARMQMAGKLTVVLGNEVTPDSWLEVPQSIGHFGVFPIPKDFDPLAYQLTWQAPADMLARIDSLYPDALIQVNHPRWDAFIGYFDVNSFDPLEPGIGKRLGLSHLDVIELWNTHELDSGGGTSFDSMLDDYFALLRLGFPLVATGNSDSHQLSRHPLGYPRNYLRVPDDAPDKLTPEAIIDALRKGAVTVTSGPWLEVSINGHGPGDKVKVGKKAPTLDILVDGASWVSLDRVFVIVDGGKPKKLDITTRPFSAHVPLDLPTGTSFVMVTVEGDAPLPPNTGMLTQPLRSLAFSNPIWFMP